MGNNRHKGMMMRTIWFQDEAEYKSLMHALEGNYTDEVLNIVFAIWLRKDLGGIL